MKDDTQSAGAEPAAASIDTPASGDPPGSKDIPASNDTTASSDAPDSNEAPSKPAAPKSGTGDVWQLVAVLGGIIVILLLVYKISGAIQDAIQAWWPALLIASGAIVAIATMVFLWRSKSPLKRLTVVLSGVVAVLLLVLAVAFLPVKARPFAVGIVWLFVAGLLPVAMYYLFIVTRRKSLLNEFISNLDRLGLIRKAEDRTITAYLEKFEAVYGRVTTDKAKLIAEIQSMRRYRAEQKEQDLTSPPWAAPSAQMRAVQLDGADELAFVSPFSPTTGIPLAFSTALIALGWLMVLSLSESAQGVIEPTTAGQFIGLLATPKEPISYAFLGAYFFSIQMLFRRYVRRDLGSSAYIAVTQRIITAVVLTWVMSLLVDFVKTIGVAGPAGPATSSESTLCLLAFTVGVFPRVGWQIVQGWFRKAAAWVSLPNLEARQPLSELDGLTVWHETRLEEEDIESVPNMATADIVELLLNTQVPPDRLIDWIDQAILFTALGIEKGSDKDPSLRDRLLSHGLRTATAVLLAYSSCRTPEDLDSFLTDFTIVQRQRLRSVVDTLCINPHFRMVISWRQLLPRPLVPELSRTGALLRGSAPTDSSRVASAAAHGNHGSAVNEPIRVVPNPGTAVARSPDPPLANPPFLPGAQQAVQESSHDKT